MSVPSIEHGTPTESLKERGERLLERRTNRPMVKIVPDRRRHRRVPVDVSGRFMREDKHEYPCQVVNMSAGGMAILAPVACDNGERIVAYLENLGRIEGVVVRSFEGGFAVRIVASLHKRERIANLLTWLVNQQSLGLSEERKHERIVPRVNASKLILPDGAVHNCRVTDVSMSGASVASAVKPEAGTMVILGRMRARVVRHHEQGVGLQFAELQDPDSLARAFS
ncbi:MAG TPA: PilZ domain-containing protein [Methyloceanibacter sp.]|jgi:PilZ domain|nr:PilZ domain-containing protein [Methyloceanibacter sp.]